MKKNILKHITVTGFASSSDLSYFKVLEKDLNKAKRRLKLAKKEVKDAKHKLDLTLDEVITKIENKKKGLKKTQDDLGANSDVLSDFNTESNKSKYDEAMSALEIRKNNIKKQLEEYNSEGTENWDSFKHKLNHDLEGLSTALKGFVAKSDTDHK